MFEHAKKTQIKHMLEFTRKDKKDLTRMLKSFAKHTKFNQRQHTYYYNGLEIYITVYPGKHPTMDLTTDYFPHTFSSDPKDIGCYDERLNWANLQGCWNSDYKMYQFVTNNIINYPEEIGPQFEEFKKANPNWNDPIGQIMEEWKHDWN